NDFLASADRWGSDCAGIVTDIIEEPPGNPALVEFTLTPQCLKAQIRRTLSQRDRNGNPGTGGLPCHLVGKPPKGDWDMAVYQITRLVYLARKSPALLDNHPTRTKLDQLMSISGPLQGESYGLFDCGNPDNTTGKAQDRADEADFYDDGFFHDVGDL